MTFLVETEFDPAKALADFTRRIGPRGALVSFTGSVRNDKNAVTGLFLEHYPEATERGIAAIETEARRRWSLKDILIIHRVGLIPVDETIVLVAAAGDHRRACFLATDFIMDYLKSEALFWKKEICQSGTKWIEPQQQDYIDKQRWTNQ